MWHKVKKFFRTIFSSSETVTVTQIVVSSYYMGIGLMLALTSKSLVFLLIFALPAVIWWVSTLAHAASLELAPNPAHA